MATITTPRKLEEKEDLMLVPLVEYKDFSDWRKTTKQFKTYAPTIKEKLEIQRAREDYKKGKFITLN